MQGRDSDKRYYHEIVTDAQGENQSDKECLHQRETD